MSSQRSLLLAFIFLILANLLVLALAQSICLNNGNYTSDSTYRENLNTLLSSLSANVDINGFYNASVGQNPDRANAFVLCRGDVLLDTCRSCSQNATSDLLKSCPNQKQAIFWNELCMLRYSNDTIFGTLATEPRYWWWNPENATSPDRFKEDLRTLLDDLRNQAADGGSLRKVAAGNITAPDFQTIFSLVQCTPDLSQEECISCLIGAAADIPKCCDNKRGGRVCLPSCYLRYEIYLFYNETRLQELVPVLAPVPVPQPPTIPLPPAVEEISTAESLQYAFGTIKVATNDFSDANKLGQGGFGVVYRGKLLNGKEIAVKRLSTNSGQGDLEFKNEVLLLARLQHRYLVRLLGFSLEGMEKLLVYEFVENGSLDQFIFDPIKRSYLDWERRCKIIGGIARGLLYLHEDSRLRIIHRDLKASNVLLDGEMNPKIADFGMARLFVQDETQGNTSRIVGTYGYMAPEYAMHGQFSVKSDVFSFGVLVLEIISGQKNNCYRDGENVQDLLSFAWKNWREGTSANMIDPFLRSGSGSMNDMLRCIHIGLLCVQENVVDRPTMASIVLMLSSFSLTLAVPSEPAFYVPSDYDSDVSLLQERNSREFEYSKSTDKSSDSKPAQSDQLSRNDCSISELYPR